MKTTIGGDRLGSGQKQEVSMKTYERSTHNKSYLWRSSMSAGTLVPFMSEVGLPGDSFDIDLNCEVMTLPTVGPLFGSYKVQLDIFEAPIRLYQGKLHMNMLNIGMDMSKILLPQVVMKADFDIDERDDNAQINPSSIWSYLNIRGLGRKANNVKGEVMREFNAVPYLAYWDIFKQYYSNKQEENAYVIHRENFDNSFQTTGCEIWGIPSGGTVGAWVDIFNAVEAVELGQYTTLKVYYDAQAEDGLPDVNKVYINDENFGYIWAVDWFNDYRIYHEQGYISYYNYNKGNTQNILTFTMGSIPNQNPVENTFPNLVSFPLKNIDDMRMDILADVKSTTPFKVNMLTYAPYGLSLKKVDNKFTKLSSQEGLAVKTYQSDLFNNWISTE